MLCSGIRWQTLVVVVLLLRVMRSSMICVKRRSAASRCFIYFFFTSSLARRRDRCIFFRRNRYENSSVTLRSRTDRGNAQCPVATSPAAAKSGTCPVRRLYFEHVSVHCRYKCSFALLVLLVSFSVQCIDVAQTSCSSHEHAVTGIVLSLFREKIFYWKRQCVGLVRK